MGPKCTTPICQVLHQNMCDEALTRVACVFRLGNSTEELYAFDAAARTWGATWQLGLRLESFDRENYCHFTFCCTWLLSHTL